MNRIIPVLKSKEAVKALCKIGFVKKRQTGSHLILYKNGKVIPIPIHSGDLKIGIVQSIIKQSGLTVEQFRKLLKKKK